MNCFNHHERQAIGVCKACGKGLCPDCLVEVANSIACKNNCEKRVTILNKLVDARLKLLSLARLYYILALATGLLFIIWGLLSYSADNTGAGLLGISVGVLLLCMGIVGAVRSRRIL